MTQLDDIKRKNQIRTSNGRNHRGPYRWLTIGSIGLLGCRRPVCHWMAHCPMPHMTSTHDIVYMVVGGRCVFGCRQGDIWQPGYLSQGAYIKVTRTGVSLEGSHMTPIQHILYIYARVARAARAPRADFI